jgi:hypothetical protein
MILEVAAHRVPPVRADLDGHVDRSQCGFQYRLAQPANAKPVSQGTRARTSAGRDRAAAAIGYLLSFKVPRK